MSIHDRDATAESWCRNTINTDSILAHSKSPNVLQRIDLNQIFSNGFQTIVDATGQGSAAQYIGYVAFGDAPATTPRNYGFIW